MDSVLTRLPAAAGRPAVTCRLAGDQFLLLEYGALEFDLALNRFARLAAEAVREAGLPGLVDLAPGVRSLLVGFAPWVNVVDAAESVLAVHERLDPERRELPPGRRITLPLAFDDSTTREAVARHHSTVASGAAPPSDIDDIVTASGLDGPDDVRRAVVERSWNVAFVGYYPGLPFLLPEDGAGVLRVPKLTRIRAWTAEGAVSLGASCVAVFPVEAPGSYRVFGRTVPIYAPDHTSGEPGPDQVLLRPGDIVRFESVTEPELTEIRRGIHENRYRCRIDGPADPAETVAR